MNFPYKPYILKYPHLRNPPHDSLPKCLLLVWFIHYNCLRPASCLVKYVWQNFCQTEMFMINHPFWGTPIYGNPHMYPLLTPASLTTALRATWLGLWPRLLRRLVPYGPRI